MQGIKHEQRSRRGKRKLLMRMRSSGGRANIMGWGLSYPKADVANGVAPKEACYLK